MARPNSRKLRGQTGRKRRTPRRSILIATNGVRTENAYLTQLKRQVDHSVLSVTILPINGEPETMMRRLRSPNGDTSAYDEVWLVVDEDGADRTGLLADCATLSKKTQQWTAVVTRPCFEAWLVAHYEPVRRYAHQADAARHFHQVSSTQKNRKELPSNFPMEAVQSAVDRSILTGEVLGEPNTLPPSPGSAMPHLLRALGLL